MGREASIPKCRRRQHHYEPGAGLKILNGEGSEHPRMSASTIPLRAWRHNRSSSQDRLRLPHRIYHRRLTIHPERRGLKILNGSRRQITTYQAPHLASHDSFAAQPASHLSSASSTLGWRLSSDTPGRRRNLIYDSQREELCHYAPIRHVLIRLSGPVHQQTGSSFLTLHQ